MSPDDIDAIAWIIRLAIFALLCLFAWNMWFRSKPDPKDSKPGDPPPKPGVFDEDDWH